MTTFTTLYIYNPHNNLQGLTNNVELTVSVGDTTSQCSISIEQDD